MECIRHLRLDFRLLHKHADLKQILKNFILMFAITNLTIVGFRNRFLFHMSTEIFSIIIAYSIFIIAINTYTNTKNNFVMFLGITFLFVGTFDIFHLMTWEGLAIWNKSGVNLSMQLWICARFIQAISMVIFCLLIYKPINYKIPLIIFTLLSVILAEAIFFLDIFPDCYIQRIGITSFKVGSEFFICAILLAAVILLIINRNRLYHTVVWTLVYALIFNILSELSCTLHYISNSGASIFSHLFKLLAFYLLYKAIVETSLKAPYKLLVNKLSNTENELQLNKMELRHITKKLSIESSERRKIEKDLLLNDDCYNMLIENSEDSIFVQSGGKIVFANSRAVEFMKLHDKNELIGKDVMGFIHPLYVKDARRVLDCIYENKKVSKPLKTVVIASNGEPIYVEVRATYLIYKRKPAVLNVIRDITSERQLEELKRSAEKNTKLLKDTLEHNRLINEFTANLAHELRTPLNVMLGSIQVLGLYRSEVNSEKVGKVDKYLCTLKQNTYRLLRLVNNIVDISKIEAGFLELHLENQDIIGVVENITLSVAPYIEAKGINLIFDTDTEEKIMAFDPDKMERIILNLLSNAAKFTEAGDEIFVTIEEQDESVIIKVSDTGSGISEQKVKEVFERFKQVDDSLTKNSQGTGIGLSLVKSLVEMHGGTINVYSELGKGTEFVMELPIKQLNPSEVTSESSLGQTNIERINIEFSDIYS